MDIKHYKYKHCIIYKDQSRGIWTAVMLVLKIKFNIFLTSVYISAPARPALRPSFLQQDICYVEVGVYRNRKQLFLSEECGIYLFLFLTYILTSYPRNIYEKNFGPTKHQREKGLDPQNTHDEKFWTHKIPTRKKFEPQNIHEKTILDPRKTNEKKIRTHEIPTRKNFEPTKYTREKISDPRRHDDTLT